MAKHMDNDEDIFPAVEKKDPFAPNFESLAEKKEHSVENLCLCYNYCTDIKLLLLKMLVQSLRCKTMQFLIKACEKLCGYLINVIHYRPATIVDYEVVTSPTIAHVKEGMAILSFCTGLIGKQI